MLWWLIMMTICLFVLSKVQIFCSISSAEPFQSLGWKSLDGNRVFLSFTPPSLSHLIRNALFFFFFEPENIQISSSCKRDSSKACRAQSKRLHFYLCWYLLLLNYLICGPSRGLFAARVWVSNLIVHVLFLHVWLLHSVMVSDKLTRLFLLLAASLLTECTLAVYSHP